MSTPAEQGRADLAKATERGWSYRATFLSAGGIVAALGAASCCVVPFLLFLAGVSGAWIGNLTALAPYQPVFTAVAVGCIGYGAYLVYCKPHAACAEGSHCIRPASDGWPASASGAPECSSLSRSAFPTSRASYSVPDNRR